MERREGSGEGHAEEPPSGVHRSLARVLVLEPDRSLHAGWTDAVGVGVEFVGGATKLGWALRKPGRPAAVSVALTERYVRARRDTLLAELHHVDALDGLRVIADARRCDLSTAVTLLVRGFIVCVDDLEQRGGVQCAALGHGTMRERMRDEPARDRLVKTLGATELSDRHGLSATEHRVLRWLMDFPGSKALSERAPMSASTARNHGQRIRQKVGAAQLSDVVRAANVAARHSAFELGQLRL